MIPLRVLGDRVLVALPPRQAEYVQASGLVLVTDPDLKTATRGIVVQVGEKRGLVEVDDVLEAIADEQDRSLPQFDDLNLSAAIRALKPAAFEVQVGDCVLFPPHQGEELEHDGIEYVAIRESEIIGIVEAVNDATTEGQEQGDDRDEHPDGDQGGETSKASRGDCAEYSATERREAVKV